MQQAIHVMGAVTWLVVIVLSSGLGWAQETPPLVVDRSSYSYDRSDLMVRRPEAFEAGREDGILRGVLGSTEYDFQIEALGWYELLFWGDGAWDNRYEIDGEILYDGFLPRIQSLPHKVGNCWLEPGAHTFRFSDVQPHGHPYWRRWGLRPAAGPSGWGHVRLVSVHSVVRAHEEFVLELISGGVPQELSYQLYLEPTGPGERVPLAEVTFPASDKPVVRELRVSCPQEGIYELRATCNGEELGATDLGYLSMVVIDTENALQPADGLKTELIYDIDCTQPWEAGYWETSPTRIIETDLGAYRETSEEKYAAFSYAIDVEQVQVPYLLEVDYPDNDRRTFGIALMEENMMQYPPVGGVDTGDWYRTSQQMQTYQLFFWPRGKTLRAVILNENPGMRAAVSRIRLYRVVNGLPAGPSGSTDGRVYGYWFEEIERWLTYFGAPDNTLQGHLVSMERWAQFARMTGANALFPTAMIYQVVSYPSQHIRGTTRSTVDLMRMVELVCEKYGLKFAPEFAPTNSAWWPERGLFDRFEPAPNHKPYLLISRDGREGTGGWREPRFNPLYPGIQEWYLSMFREAVERWGDSPAFLGVSSRCLEWQWLSANILATLNWGYGDFTVNLFEQETGIEVPGEPGDPERFRQRFEFLTTEALEEWLQWRCDKILDYHRRLVEVLRTTPTANGQLRPDLKLFLPGHHILRQPIDHLGWITDNQRDHLRELGLNPEAYSREPGIIFLPSFYYGRRNSTPEADAYGREFQLDAEGINLIRTPEGRGFLFGNWYFEFNQRVDPRKLGLPDNEPQGWCGASDPAGRNYLERFALALADGDASYVMDGGLGYVFGQPRYLQEFLSEYRQLPAVNFEPLAEARDPVAVWTYAAPEGLYFYAVNRMAFPLELRLQFRDAKSVSALGSGEEIALRGGWLVLGLEAFQLRAFRAPPGAKIVGVRTVVPNRERERLARSLSDAQVLAEDLSTAPSPPEPPRWRLVTGVEAVTAAERVVRFQEGIVEAERELEAGHLWRARAALEYLPMVEVYEALGRYPRGLRYRQVPPVPAKALRAPDLLSLVTLPGQGTLASSTELAADWSGDQVLAFSTPEATIGLQADFRNRYELMVGYVTQGGDDISVLANGKLRGTLAAFPPQQPRALKLLEPLVLTPGPVELTFRKPDGRPWGLYFVLLRPLYREITAEAWMMVGPYSSGVGNRGPGPGLQEIFPPELFPQADSYPVAGEQAELSWEAAPTSGEGVDFYEKYGTHLEGIGYARTYLYSPDRRAIALSFGVDYWGKIWVNEDLVLDLPEHGKAPHPGEFLVPARLAPGWNRLLVKVHGGSGGNRFWLAVSDPGDLKILPRPPFS